MSDKTIHYHFDLSSCYSPEDVHDVIRDELPLPQYYGGNLDALYDVLTDPHEPWVLSFTGCTTVTSVIGAKYMKAFKKMCSDASGDNENLTILFDD